MKITEPKTPFVRYNAELDIVENMEGPLSSKTALSHCEAFSDARVSLIDIPKFTLDRRNSNPPTPSSPAFNDSASNASRVDGQQTMSPEAQASELPPAASSEERRASFASKQRSSSTGSRSSSRSTSFHLPDEDRVRLRRKSAEGGETIDGDDDELDPEGGSLFLLKPLDPFRA
jgi:protein phosphatase inhibitor 2